MNPQAGFTRQVPMSIVTTMPPFAPSTTPQAPNPLHSSGPTSFHSASNPSFHSGPLHSSGASMIINYPTSDQKNRRSDSSGSNSMQICTLPPASASVDTPFLARSQSSSIDKKSLLSPSHSPSGRSPMHSPFLLPRPFSMTDTGTPRIPTPKLPSESELNAADLLRERLMESVRQKIITEEQATRIMGL